MRDAHHCMIAHRRPRTLTGINCAAFVGRRRAGRQAPPAVPRRWLSDWCSDCYTKPLHSVARPGFLPGRPPIRNPCHANCRFDTSRFAACPGRTAGRLRQAGAAAASAAADCGGDPGGHARGAGPGGGGRAHRRLQGGRGTGARVRHPRPRALYRGQPGAGRVALVRDRPGAIRDCAGAGQGGAGAGAGEERADPARGRASQGLSRQARHQPARSR